MTVTLTSDDRTARHARAAQFTAANWNIDQQVTITATDDGKVEGVRLSRMVSAVTSPLATGGVYSAGVVDDPTGRSASTTATPAACSSFSRPARRSSRHETATYTIQLTRPPTAPVTVTIITDGQTLVSSSDPRLATGGLGGCPRSFAAGHHPDHAHRDRSTRARRLTSSQPIQEFASGP